MPKIIVTVLGTREESQGRHKEVVYDATALQSDVKQWAPHNKGFWKQNRDRYKGIGGKPKPNRLFVATSITNVKPLDIFLQTALPKHCWAQCKVLQL